MTQSRVPFALAPSAWTLRAKLVASTLVLFAIVSLVTSAVIILATRQYLTRQLDSDLRNAADRAAMGRGGPRGDERPGSAPGGGAAVLRLWLRDGEVVTDNDGDAVNVVVTKDNTEVALDSAQIAALTDADLASAPQNIDLGPDIGEYRVIAFSARDLTAITGVPTAPIGDTVRQLLGLFTGGTLLGLVAVGAGGAYLVRRNLEPLQRAASTARRVSTLKLDSGEVALAERIPHADTDPRTEVGQVGLAINSMLDNVDTALRARHESEMRVRQFVADASHELRTPLASVRGYAELTRREPDPVPETVVHALRRIESESLRMQGLVEDLLLLARLDARRPLDRGPVDLSLLTMDAVSDARAASPDHQWELELPAEPVEVPGDRARLHQVLANLLANARTHTPAGSRVLTTLSTSPDAVTLSVTDNGPGVPESLRPNVFERFTRGDGARTRATGSTGLGLSIVNAVAEAHGGQVGLSSTPGSTTFSVVLPRRLPGASTALPSGATDG